MMCIEDSNVEIPFVEVKRKFVYNFCIIFFRVSLRDKRENYSKFDIKIFPFRFSTVNTECFEAFISYSSFSSLTERKKIKIKFPYFLIAVLFIVRLATFA